MLAHRLTLSGKENGMRDASVHDHERYGGKSPERRPEDHGRETGDVSTVITNGTDTNCKNPPNPDRGGDDSSSGS